MVVLKRFYGALVVDAEKLIFNRIPPHSGGDILLIFNNKKRRGGKG